MTSSTPVPYLKMRRWLWIGISSAAVARMICRISAAKSFVFVRHLPQIPVDIPSLLRFEGHQQ
jgi:hypothetical protein